MGLEETWRWFGPHDPVTLREVKQTGARGVVTALHQIPVGEIWPADEIRKRQALIEAEGLRWVVAESVPVHEEIKKRTGHYRRWVENYKESLRNLGRCGVGIVCYNFMPVLDWVRTDLHVVYRDGSITTKFDPDVFAAFDLFILRREGAERDYGMEQIARAKLAFEAMSVSQRETLTETILLGLPGSLEAYALEQLRGAIREYQGISRETLLENLKEFLKDIIPAAEESGIRMAIHPDDPPWSLLGLPRVVTGSRDLDAILGVRDSPSNGITLCTGSYGASCTNNLVEMATRYARRIVFAHLRNVTRDRHGHFSEENHLEGDLDIPGVVRALLMEQARREREGGSQIPYRPDHGHLMSPDDHREGIYPGYSLFGRMRGLAELRGLELGIRMSMGQ